MKTFKIPAFFLFFFCANLLFPQETPPLLSGVWDGKDRLVYFVPESETQKSSVAFMLKTLYGWYYDRPLEPEYFASFERPVNNVSVNEAEKASVRYEDVSLHSVSFETVKDNKTSGVWEICLTYADKSESKIPAAVIDGKLYLNFVIKPRRPKALSEQTEDGGSENPIYGFWQGVGQSSGITVSRPVIESELTSFYITENAIYHIRYWLTDMEYSGAEATFSDGDKTYSVAKHILSAGNVYTCVTGRSLQIRNVERSPFNLENYTLDSTGTICAFGKPYLVKNSDTAADENERIKKYMQIALDANKRRKPDPPPLFPPSDVNWHWDDIRRLEKGNAQIEAVRGRQRDFARQSQVKN